MPSPSRARSCVLAALLFAAGCDDSGSSTLASAVIGPAGGAVSIASGSLAGAAVNVPAGALATDTTVALARATAIDGRGTDVVGDALRISPADASLSAAATITLPYDPDRVPIGTLPGRLRVVVGDGVGGTTGVVVPDAVDPDAGTVTFTTTMFGTFWVTARSVYAGSDYLVLHDGDRYEFEGDNALDVVLAVGEPNFASGPVWRYVFRQPFFGRTGVYLDDAANDGAVQFRGQLDAPLGNPARQEIADEPFTLLGARERVGEERTEDYSYVGYSINQPDPPQQEYTGTGEIRVTLVGEQSLDTPAGRFDRVLEFEFVSTFEDTRPEVGGRTTRLWLAEDVGPVQIQIDGATPQQLLRARVDGRIYGSF